MSKPVRPWYWPENGQPERTEAFTWIVQDVIAASWWPDPYVFDIYKENNIKAVVNCCEFDNAKDVPKQMAYHHINVPDFGVPTDKQIDQFLDLMDGHHQAREAVGIHCVAGCGRTGQFIIAWCAKAGFIPKGANPVDCYAPKDHAAWKPKPRKTAPNVIARSIGDSPVTQAGTALRAVRRCKGDEQINGPRAKHLHPARPFGKRSLPTRGARACPRAQSTHHAPSSR